jgi:hypothetical protein
MEATKDHISLETAKLLKDCEVESKYWYYRNHAGVFIREKDKNKNIIEMFGHHWEDNWYYPAYTWLEIEDNCNKFFKPLDTPFNWADGYTFVLDKIRKYRGREDYKEADLYFRENCILIKDKYMEATKDHISLETAKLLKDCGVRSKHYFYMKQGTFYFTTDDYFLNDYEFVYPAYTWGEILWEYPEQFFGDIIGPVLYDEDYEKYITDYDVYDLIRLLQEKQYKEADLHFREKCRLIKD